MRTPRPFLRPFPNGLALALIGGVWMACLNPQPDELPTYAGNPSSTGNGPPTGSQSGAAAGSGPTDDQFGNGDNAGAAGSSAGGVEAPAADAGAPPETVDSDAGPDAGIGLPLGDAGVDDGGAP